MLRIEFTELGTNSNDEAKGNTLEEVKKNPMEQVQTVHKDLPLNMSPQQMTDMDKTLTHKTD
jgi:hypothetical protein